jgi:putative membrane protein insertion efficiency factor
MNTKMRDKKMARIIIGFIYAYRWLVSPVLPPRCRFNPTCSRYAIHAIECHGVPRGLWMAFKRLLRCHPYERLSARLGKTWGYDPVEPAAPINTSHHTFLKHAKN